jgi:hypothetical protein
MTFAALFLAAFLGAFGGGLSPQVIYGSGPPGSVQPSDIGGGGPATAVHSGGDEITSSGPPGR